MVEWLTLELLSSMDFRHSIANNVDCVIGLISCKEVSKLLRYTHCYDILAAVNDTDLDPNDFIHDHIKWPYSPCTNNNFNKDSFISFKNIIGVGWRLLVETHAFCFSSEGGATIMHKSSIQIAPNANHQKTWNSSNNAIEHFANSWRRASRFC